MTPQMLSDITANITTDEALDLTRRLAATPSQCGVDDEIGVARILQETLETEGIEVELLEVSAGRPNVLARIPGRGEAPSLMFNGHMDTTPLDASWSAAHRVHVDGDVVRAHGARNMKGGVASIVLTLLAWQRSGVRPPGDLLFTAVMGHHQGGVGTRALMQQIEWPQHTIIPEPTDLGIRTVQTGSLTLRIRVRGRTAPVGDTALFSRYAQRADRARNPLDALDVVERALTSVPYRFVVDERVPDLPMTQVRHVSAGYGENMLPMAFAPDTMELGVGVFTTKGQRPDRVRDEVAAHLRAVLAPFGFHVDVELVGSFRDFLDVPIDAPVVESLAQAHHEVVGTEATVGALLPHSYFGCDGQILAMEGLDAISYGPGSHAYRYDSRGRVEIRHVVTCARALTLAPLRLAERTTV